MKEDLYTAYYAVSENEEIVADRDVEISGMEEDMLVERTAESVAELEANVEVINPAYSQKDISAMSDIHKTFDVNVARMDESITDVTNKNKFVETKETESVDKAGWIVRKISELGGYENVGDHVKADVFGFDIADVSGSIRLFSDVMKRLEIKMDGDELYKEFQRIYDDNIVNKTLDEEKVENTMVRSKVRR